MRMNRWSAVLVLATVLSAGLRAASAQQPLTSTLDESIAPGANYDKAEFRLWMPPDAGRVQAIVVLVPGSNGDGRPMADDAAWQAFATKNKLALVACRFTDKPHEQMFIEHYVNVSQGAGQALLDALAKFASRSQHPELTTAPFLMWGMSAGGEFNYEFVAWKPERVAAFVVNKGGIYYTALASQAARAVPGILFVGGKDLEFRTNTIVGLFAVNRRAGALWALAEEPNAAHVVGRSLDVAKVLFEDVLAVRGTGATFTEKGGWLGDLKAKTFDRVPDVGAPNYPTAWLPTERVARAWKSLVTESPMPND